MLGLSRKSKFLRIWTLEKALYKVMRDIEIAVHVFGARCLHKDHLKILALRIDRLASDVMPEHRALRDEKFEDVAKLFEAYGAENDGYWHRRNIGHEPNA